MTLKASTIPVYCAHDEIVDVTTLVPNPRNPNTHPDKQVALLAKIIQHQGWRNPIVVSNRSGFIVKGHGRLEAAKLLQVETVPIDRQDYENEAQEWADMIADNRIAELADTDVEMLIDLLIDLDTGSFDMDLTGFDENSLSLAIIQNQSDVDAEPQLDKAEELRAKWACIPGQLWQLGNHRLLCGDSTKADDVARVLAGEKPILMVTDPPYGVNYDANWRNEADRANGKPLGDRAVGKVKNDDRSDWADAWKQFPGDVAYVWHGGIHAAKVASSLDISGFEIRSQIVWAKPSLVIGRGHYHWQHEPCWYAVRKGAAGQWIGDRKQSTVWEIPNMHRTQGSVDDGKTLHSTQKPVECMARAIRNHSSDFIYEPFSGSGTTIIACEQLGRKCRAIEISPAYVAVALQRYKDATGKQPILI